MIKSWHIKTDEGVRVGVKLKGPFGILFQEIGGIIENANDAITAEIKDAENRIGARRDLAYNIEKVLYEIKCQTRAEITEQQMQKEAEQAMEDERQADISEIEFAMRMEQEQEKE